MSELSLKDGEKPARGSGCRGVNEGGVSLSRARLGGGFLQDILSKLGLEEAEGAEVVCGKETLRVVGAHNDVRSN